MGINFERITHGEIGDIIYPAYNGTSGFWKKRRWDIVMDVDREGRIVHISYIWDYATVRAIKLMQGLKQEKKK